MTIKILLYSHRWTDQSQSRGRDGVLRPFNHPFVQAVGMFLGEMLCLLGFKVLYLYYKSKDYTNDQLPPSISGNRHFNPFIFALPALCDLCSTSIMYIGLNLTYASSFQMIRGSLIIFTSIFSVAFLRRKLQLYQVLGIVFVITGLVGVGLSDVMSHTEDSKNPNAILTGDLLIILAQISTATQMVLEEKFINSRQVSPLQVVGWEGFFGFTILSLLCIPMYFINVGNMIMHNPEGRMEDAIDAFYQIKNNWIVSTGLTATIISIAFFNFAGVSVTKQMSATTRTVLDSIRTFIIKLAGIMFLNEKLHYVQLIGFALLLLGMMIYNDLLLRSCSKKLFKKYGQIRDGLENPVLNEEGENEPSLETVNNGYTV